MDFFIYEHIYLPCQLQDSANNDILDRESESKLWKVMVSRVFQLQWIGAHQR